MQTNTNIPHFDVEDIEKNKAMAGLSYLYILFFLPLVVAPDSQFGRFHANQALLNFLASIACSIILVIPIIGWIVGGIGQIVVLVFAIKGIIGAFKGEANRLPLYGKFDIIK
ncbi:MAG: hypothetical protein ACOX8S_04660 [Christensenellales bacterium]|jgi:uncharacterized membrane protein